MPCDYPQDRYGCVRFRDWEKSLDEGCNYPCFMLAADQPEKTKLEKKMSLPRLQPPPAPKEDLPLPETITTPVVLQPSAITSEAPKPPITQGNPLLGAFLIAAASSIGVPLLKDWVKSKIKKKDDDSPIECKPSQVRTNKKLKELSARIDKLEGNISVDAGDSLEEIKKRLTALESNE